VSVKKNERNDLGQREMKEEKAIKDFSQVLAYFNSDNLFKKFSHLHSIQNINQGPSL